MKIRFYPRAEDDLIGQFRYYLVEQDSPAAAVGFRETVRASVEQLKSYPRMGALVSGSIPGLRSWPVKGYEAIRVYYVEKSGGLDVVRILHGRRDVRRILKTEARPGHSSLDD